MSNTYALSIVLPGLPAGEKTYHLLSRESAENRSDSLTALETMENLLSSLEESEETALRALLSESASGEEEPLTLAVSESNYLVLASIIDHMALPAASAEVLPSEALEEGLQAHFSVAEHAEDRASLQAGLAQINALHALLMSDKFQESLTPKAVEEIADEPIMDSALTESLIHIIGLSEKVLGLTPTLIAADISTSDLKAQASYIRSRAEEFTSVAVEVTESVPAVIENDTLPLVVTNPTLGENFTPVVTTSDLPDVRSLRQAAGRPSSEDRKRIRQGL